MLEAILEVLSWFVKPFKKKKSSGGHKLKDSTLNENHIDGESNTVINNNAGNVINNNSGIGIIGNNNKVTTSSGQDD